MKQSITNDFPVANSADRQKIGILIASYQDQNAEEQCEWDVDPNYDRASQIAKKDPLNQEDQYAPKDEIVQHGLGGNVDERGAVIERHQLHPRWEGSIIVDLVDLRPDARYHIISMERAIPYDDSSNYVVLIVASRLAESRNVAGVNFSDILHEYREAL
jgi:hypothetical protein